MTVTAFSEFFSELQFDHLRRKVALRPVPLRIDADRLDVYALLVHLPQAIGPQDLEPAGGRGAAQQLHHAGQDAMRVKVYDLDPASAHHHLPASGGPAGLPGLISPSLGVNFARIGPTGKEAFIVFAHRFPCRWQSRAVKVFRYCDNKVQVSKICFFYFKKPDVELF